MNQIAVNIDNLTVKYNETTALQSVTLRVPDREYLGIIGPNGGGKTTFLKTLLGLIKPSNGSVEIYGEKPGSPGARVGYVPQITVLDKSFPVTVCEVVLTGMLKSELRLFHHYTAQEKEKADELLERVGILKLKRRQISAISGGEFQKMLIARALAVKPDLLLLDEPTASVDATSREQIYNLLGELNNNMTIILVTHDMLAISSHVKTLACLNGRLVYHGDKEISEKVVRDLYGCPIDLIAHGVPHRVLKEHKGGI